MQSNENGKMSVNFIDFADSSKRLGKIKKNWYDIADTNGKSMAEELRRKVQTFAEVTKTRKGIQLTLVAPYGTASNLYRHTVQSVVTLDDLFR